MGYEYTYESIVSTSVISGKKELNNYAGFLNVEWSPVKKLLVRPGLRMVKNTLYPSPLIYSLSTKYVLPAGLDMRLSFGRSYRTPNLTELYYYFVDANHDVQGNDNLSPEDGYGASFDLKKISKLKKGQITTSLKVFYNDIRDQITLSIVNESPLQYKYINVDQFKSQGVTLLGGYADGPLNINAGYSFIGRYNELEENIAGSEEFLYSSELNFNAMYRIPAVRMMLSAFYKHTGKVEQYIAVEDGFQKGTTHAYDWLDFTVSWEATSSFRISAGAKNILDISDVRTTAGQAGAHSGAPSSVGLSYGRSYFLKLQYDFGKFFNTQNEQSKL